MTEFRETGCHLLENAQAVIRDIMLLTPPTVSGQAAVLADSSADVRAIMAARARSNAAIASRDTAGVVREMMPDATVVSSTSAMGTGVEVNVSRMAAQFARRPDTRWIRTPDAVAVSEARSARVFLESPLHERA